MSNERFNVERVQANLQAIAELRKEQPDIELLKKYTGWGGLRNAIFNPDVYRVLKKHCTQWEITSIKQTTTSAYYTPHPLVAFIFEALSKLNKPFNHILEPSAGHGLFFEHMPEQFKNKREAVEIDKISCKLIAHLYPDVTLYQGGFETFHPETSFDLIIGNPPYGQETVVDSTHTDISSLRIHHYFVAKCMRLLAPGGILAMVLPRYFLDNRKEHARTIIQQEGGSLLAAFRLPDDLFSDAKVSVDVVFLIKETSNIDWISCEKRWIDNEAVYLNRYFVDNPSHVIGKLAIIEAYGRTELTCRQRENGLTAFADLSRHLDFFPPQKLPSLHECKTKLTNRLTLIEKQIASLNRLRNELIDAERDLHLMERQFLKSCCSKIKFDFTAL